MKNLTLSLSRFAVVLVGALSLGACNRAAYSTLSPADALATSVPVAQQSAAPYAPVAAEESAVVKAAPPAAPAATTAVPALAAPAPAVAAAPAVVAAPVASAAPTTPKPTLVQRLALRKITKKLDKMATQLPQLKKQDASAARGGLDSNLRSAILFGAIGLILLILGSVSNIFAVFGAIALVVGVVFLVLWLLDQA